MSKIDDLIQQLCPEGVEYKKLGEVLSYEQPSKYIIKSTDYEEYGTPVLTAGQTFILGYTSEREGIYSASENNPVIIFDDFTTSFHWVTFDFKVKSSAMKMLKPTSSDVCFRYLYYAMKCIRYETSEHARQWIAKYSQFEIPLPPLSVQQEIVRILDAFTQLEAQLEAELEARKQQYAYYRDSLLSFEQDDPNVQWKKLGEVCEIKRGKRVVRKDLKAEGYCPVYQNSLIPLGFYDKANYKANTTFVISAGAAGDIGYSKTDFWAADDCLGIPDSHRVISRYVYHFLLTKQKFIKGRVRKASVPRLAHSVIDHLEIPLPPLSVQQEIVRKLDKFEAITSDLQSGLPAEIEARKQQYAYYRDKLLTFKRKEV